MANHAVIGEQGSSAPFDSDGRGRRQLLRAERQIRRKPYLRPTKFQHPIVKRRQRTVEAGERRRVGRMCVHNHHRLRRGLVDGGMHFPFG